LRIANPYRRIVQRPTKSHDDAEDRVVFRVGALGRGRGHRPSGPSSKRTPGAGADVLLGSRRVKLRHGRQSFQHAVDLRRVPSLAALGCWNATCVELRGDAVQGRHPARLEHGNNRGELDSLSKRAG
jgi:hypothetical protein